MATHGTNSSIVELALLRWQVGRRQWLMPGSDETVFIPIIYAVQHAVNHSRMWSYIARFVYIKIQGPMV